MTAVETLRAGRRRWPGLCCLAIFAGVACAEQHVACAQEEIPLRQGLEPSGDSMAPWAYRQPPEAAPPNVELGPVVPGDAPPFAPEQAWPDRPLEYDPELDSGLRARAAELRQSMRSWLGIGFDRSERYIGLGDPLTNTSWQNRPWSLGTFFGARFHDQPLKGRLAQSNSSVMGLRLGRDFDYYWGLEGRFSFSNPDLFEPGVPNQASDSHNYFVDVSVMYYPWGDSRWRPYFSAGLGAATYRFTDNLDVGVADSALYMPLGIGLKYFQSPWLSLRLDAAYELSLGTNMIDAQSSFTIAAAAELRFGGRRQSYFPWDGGTILW